MNKLMAFVVFGALCAASAQASAVRQGFHCTAYTKDANGNDVVQLDVTANLSTTGTISSDVFVTTADGLFENYRGTAYYIGEDIVTLQSRKNNTAFDFSYFGQTDTKNFSRFVVKLPSGETKKYETKQVGCVFF